MQDDEAAILKSAYHPVPTHHDPTSRRRAWPGGKRFFPPAVCHRFL